TMRPIAGLIVLALGVGCSSLQRTTETAAASALISDEQEAELGKQVKDELEQKEKVRYVADPAVAGYVNGVAQKVIAFATKDRPNIKWEVHTIDDPKTVNAFAT